MFHANVILYCEGRLVHMGEKNKTYSMSIRVSLEELDRLKQASRLESYASYSEFVRRTALLEATRVIKQEKRNNSEEK